MSMDPFNTWFVIILYKWSQFLLWCVSQSLGGCNRCQMINISNESGQVKKSNEPLTTLASYRRVKVKHSWSIFSPWRKRKWYLIIVEVTKWWSFHLDSGKDLVWNSSEIWAWCKSRVLDSSWGRSQSRERIGSRLNLH